MTVRRHRVFLGFIGLQLAAVTALVAWGRADLERRHHRELPGRCELVRVLGLTDLAIWTEARYTRHPSQADAFSAFQDLPSSLEHFPAGSIVPPAGVAGGAGPDRD